MIPLYFFSTISSDEIVFFPVSGLLRFSHIVVLSLIGLSTAYSPAFPNYYVTTNGNLFNCILNILIAFSSTSFASTMDGSKHINLPKVKITANGIFLFMDLLQSEEMWYTIDKGNWLCSIKQMPDTDYSPNC